jgi:hypothetical protein
MRMSLGSPWDWLLFYVFTPFWLYTPADKEGLGLWVLLGIELGIVYIQTV